MIRHHDTSGAGGKTLPTRATTTGRPGSFYVSRGSSVSPSVGARTILKFTDHLRPGRERKRYMRAKTVTKIHGRPCMVFADTPRRRERRRPTQQPKQQVDHEEGDERTKGRKEGRTEGRERGRGGEGERNTPHAPFVSPSFRTFPSLSLSLCLFLSVLLHVLQKARELSENIILEYSRHISNTFEHRIAMEVLKSRRFESSRAFPANTICCHFQIYSAI